MIYRLAFVAVLAGVLTGCATSGVRHAYISPAGSCGYKVYLGSPYGFDENVELSKCMPLQDSWTLANTINNDMAGKWSAGKE